MADGGVSRGEDLDAPSVEFVSIVSGESIRPREFSCTAADRQDNFFSDLFLEMQVEERALCAEAAAARARTTIKVGTEVGTKKASSSTSDGDASDDDNTDDTSNDASEDDAENAKEMRALACVMQIDDGVYKTACNAVRHGKSGALELLHMQGALEGLALFPSQLPLFVMTSSSWMTASVATRHSIRRLRFGRATLIEVAVQWAQPEVLARLDHLLAAAPPSTAESVLGGGGKGVARFRQFHHDRIVDESVKQPRKDADAADDSMIELLIQAIVGPQRDDTDADSDDAIEVPAERALEVFCWLWRECVRPRHLEALAVCTLRTDERALAGLVRPRAAAILAWLLEHFGPDGGPEGPQFDKFVCGALLQRALGVPWPHEATVRRLAAALDDDVLVRVHCQVALETAVPAQTEAVLRDLVAQTQSWSRSRSRTRSATPTPTPTRRRVTADDDDDDDGGGGGGGGGGATETETETKTKTADDWSALEWATDMVWGAQSLGVRAQSFVAEHVSSLSLWTKDLRDAVLRLDPTSSADSVGSVALSSGMVAAEVQRQLRQRGVWPSWDVGGRAAVESVLTTGVLPPDAFADADTNGAAGPLWFDRRGRFADAFLRDRSAAHAASAAVLTRMAARNDVRGLQRAWDATLALRASFSADDGAAALRAATTAETTVSLRRSGSVSESVGVRVPTPTRPFALVNGTSFLVAFWRGAVACGAKDAADWFVAHWDAARADVVGSELPPLEQTLGAEWWREPWSAAVATTATAAARPLMMQARDLLRIGFVEDAGVLVSRNLFAWLAEHGLLRSELHDASASSVSSASSGPSRRALLKARDAVFARTAGRAESLLESVRTKGLVAEIVALVGLQARFEARLENDDVIDDVINDVDVGVRGCASESERLTALQRLEASVDSGLERLVRAFEADWNAWHSETATATAAATAATLRLVPSAAQVLFDAVFEFAVRPDRFGGRRRGAADAEAADAEAADAASLAAVRWAWRNVLGSQDKAQLGASFASLGLVARALNAGRGDVVAWIADSAVLDMKRCLGDALRTDSTTTTTTTTTTAEILAARIDLAMEQEILVQWPRMARAPSANARRRTFEVLASQLERIHARLRTRDLARSPNDDVRLAYWRRALKIKCPEDWSPALVRCVALRAVRVLRDTSAPAGPSVQERLERGFWAELGLRVAWRDDEFSADGGGRGDGRECLAPSDDEVFLASGTMPPTWLTLVQWVRDQLGRTVGPDSARRKSKVEEAFDRLVLDDFAAPYERRTDLGLGAREKTRDEVYAVLELTELAAERAAEVRELQAADRALRESSSSSSSSGGDEPQCTLARPLWGLTGGEARDLYVAKAFTSEHARTSGVLGGPRGLSGRSRPLSRAYVQSVFLRAAARRSLAVHECSEDVLGMSAPSSLVSLCVTAILRGDRKSLEYIWYLLAGKEEASRPWSCLTDVMVLDLGLWARQHSFLMTDRPSAAEDTSATLAWLWSLSRRRRQPRCTAEHEAAVRPDVRNDGLDGLERVGSLVALRFSPKVCLDGCADDGVDDDEFAAWAASLGVAPTEVDAVNCKHWPRWFVAAHRGSAADEAWQRLFVAVRTQSVRWMQLWADLDRRARLRDGRADGLFGWSTAATGALNRAMIRRVFDGAFAHGESNVAARAWLRTTEPFLSMLEGQTPTATTTTAAAATTLKSTATATTATTAAMAATSSVVSRSWRTRVSDDGDDSDEIAKSP